MTSEHPKDDRCGAECRNGEYCENYPLEGQDRCRLHGGASPTGEDNGSYEHGAFSKHFRSDLTDSETASVEDFVDRLEQIDDGRAVAAETAAEALMKYKRSADTRFLREARQWIENFNLLPNADELQVDHSGVDVSSEVVEVTDPGGDDA